MIYVVFVKDEHRWIDSLWVSKSKAAARVIQIKESVKHFGNDGLVSVWASPFDVQDATISEAPE